MIIIELYPISILLFALAKKNIYLFDLFFITFVFNKKISNIGTIVINRKNQPGQQLYSMNYYDKFLEITNPKPSNYWECNSFHGN